ncbi:hypothetical protein GLOIN_2v1826331 [Rhizophagus irregularis DAOM 181602=DAOM 197198]|nr:hypothetical protein GLOIN_2v1826331 [Rhizophagus irregularis DAOM 181602=DAOM 197198]
MAFNQAYSELLAKLPASIINEAWIRLTSRRRNPLSEKEASEINPIVDWPECPTSFKKIPFIFVSDNDTQTDNITWPEALKYDHEEENNRRVMNELKSTMSGLMQIRKCAMRSKI